MHTQVDELLDQVEGNLSGIDIKLLLREAYETAYGITNHDDPGQQRPLGLVAATEKETYSKNSGLYQRMERYRFHDIYSKFGLSIDQFLDLPREHVEMLFKISTEHEERLAPELEAQRQALKSLNRSPRG